jgi:hypothetical protein
MRLDGCLVISRSPVQASRVAPVFPTGRAGSSSSCRDRDRVTCTIPRRRSRPVLEFRTVGDFNVPRLTLTTLLLTAGFAFTLHGQPVGKAAAPKISSRSGNGHGDVEGVWMNGFATPLERPKELEGRARLTDAEVAELNRRAKKIFENGSSDAAAPDGFFLAALRNLDVYKSGGATDSAERVLEFTIDNRTSLITDPPDGKIPPLTEEGKGRIAAYRLARSGRGNPSSTKEVALGDRCITFGVPRVSGEYSAGLYGFSQIVQAPGQVLFFSEAIHQWRVIPTDGRPHLPANVRAWDGDARGRWENGTLVVDTTNFRDQLNSYGFSEKLHLIERFTRVSPDELDYAATFDDPSTWARPWTAMVRLKRSDRHLYEFACHEGNEEIMKTILSGPHPSEH